VLHFIYNTLAVIGGFSVVIFLWQFIVAIVTVIELDRKATADKAAEENEIRENLENVR